MASTIPPESSFDAHYGLELLEEDGPDGSVRARVRVRDEVKQPFGLVHGGVLASMAEAMASRGTYVKVAGEGRIAVGLSNETRFLRPITEGHVGALARPRHRGEDLWVWDVELFDDERRLCALSRVQIAVRERPGSSR